ncbi:hypothetical protein JOD21_000887 [Jeotgalibacillus terrae]|nr:hypothetical protein [Jeotgalibacillus terrae]
MYIGVVNHLFTLVGVLDSPIPQNIGKRAREFNLVNAFNVDSRFYFASAKTFSFISN